MAWGRNVPVTWCKLYTSLNVHKLGHKNSWSRPYLAILWICNTVTISFFRARNRQYGSGFGGLFCLVKSDRMISLICLTAFLVDWYHVSSPQAPHLSCMIVWISCIGWGKWFSTSQCFQDLCCNAIWTGSLVSFHGFILASSLSLLLLF